MKTKRIQLITITLCSLLGTLQATGIPVFDGANLSNNIANHAATITKWVESIAQLKAQIAHLKQQIDIQSELRDWSGDPKKAAGDVVLDVLRETDLNRAYGQSRDAVARSVRSLDTLFYDDGTGAFQTVDIPDLDGGTVRHNSEAYHRYSLLDAQRDNTRRVIDATRERERELLEEIALTLDELRAAATDAQVQKLSAKLSVLNGQLAQVESARRREIDEVILQKIANNTRREVEQIAAEEIRAKNDYLASQRVTAFMQKINPYKGKI